MFRNDQLAEWDRENFFHPSTHLGEFARGELAHRVIAGGTNCQLKIVMVIACLTLSRVCIV